MLKNDVISVKTESSDCDLQWIMGTLGQAMARRKRCSCVRLSRLCTLTKGILDQVK